MKGNEKFWLCTHLNAELWALEVPEYAPDVCVKEKKNYAVVDIVHMWQEPFTPVEWSWALSALIFVVSGKE